MVTILRWPSANTIGLPLVRDRVTALPANAEAAVTPIARTIRGRTSARTWSNQTLQDLDLGSVGLLVQPPLAARPVLEVLHHVDDVDRVAVDVSLRERAVEYLAGRPLAKRGLGRIPVERAAPASPGLAGDLRERSGHAGRTNCPLPGSG